MGRTMKWLKGILGINKEKHQKANSGIRQSCLGHSVREPILESTDDDSLICQNPHTIPPNLTPAEAAWLKSFYSESDHEQQSRHAIAVAAATAAAADAAVAAAHAAAVVVRLTSQGAGRRSGSLVGNNGGAVGREKWGAIKIQTVFRGYLARKALRALKGLVKLQAIVRGYLVRKQADATFLSMQVLIRSAQSTIRAQRNRALINSTSQLQHPPYNTLKTLEEVTSQERNSFLHSTSRRISATFDNTNTDINAVEESPKIVEMDTGRPKSRSRRSMVSDSGEENNEDDEDCTSSHHTQSSTCPYHPPRLSIPEWQHSDSLEEHNHKWVDDCRGYTTAQSTPRFATNCCGNNSSPVITPAMSVCVESLFRNYGKYCPNYMADTQSFKAKLRSQSAPKQRPAEQYPAGTKRRQSIHEMMGSRNSLSGVKMQRSCSNAQEAINFKNAVISKLGRSTEFVRDQCTRDY